MQTLDTYQTWYYIPLPYNIKAIGYKGVFKVKYNSNGSIERYKVRLIVQKFSQIYGINYTETFASIIRHESLIMFLAIIAILMIILMQVDIIRAYIESTISQNEQLIYIKIPQRCLAYRERLVYKIVKSLYRLKQIGRLWNKIIIMFFQKIGFISINIDTCIFTIQRKRELIIMSVYIDKLILDQKMSMY